MALVKVNLDDFYAIGEVASRSGLSVSALRYYEDKGLVASAGRRGGKRFYAEAIFEQLEIIRLCSTIGFSLDETKLLMRRTDDRANFARLAELKLHEIEQARRDMLAARKLLCHALVCSCVDVVECMRASEAPPDLLGLSRGKAPRFKRKDRGA